MTEKTIEQERHRIGAILQCEEAKGREQMARHLAFETDYDIQAARKLLAAAVQTEVRRGALHVAMAAIGNPRVGVDGDMLAALDLQRTSATEIYAARKAAASALRIPGDGA